MTDEPQVAGKRVWPIAWVSDDDFRRLNLPWPERGEPGYWELITAHAQATAVAQGLPPMIEDEAVYDLLASIVVNAERSRAARRAR